MAFQDRLTQLWVKTTGKKIDQNDYEWLKGPFGHTDVIKDKYIYEIAKKDNLVVEKNERNSGLLEDFETTINQAKNVHPKILDFYKNTSNYSVDIWSKWNLFFKPFGFLLSFFFGKRLQQLNVPLNSLDTAQGLKSEIIKLKDGTKTIWTIWFRKVISTNNVVFSGIYTTCKNPNFKHNLVKVIFPLPNGNATVFMTTEVTKKGDFILRSNGKKFGENGFYFNLKNKNNQYYTRFVKAMHEKLEVYVDTQQVLRASHTFYFYTIPFLKLHYKMNETTSLK